ncbi:ran-binding protein 1 homolog c-like isoform X1 [Papaver somniferum]|uniref:ran-binding protein 1 homolog c-like isoform X1 n=1 Tax=Papaver somniferum TaxID=3469 RepID=UPI000E6FB03B|nr:ran-binding protein 1 homolog c-like isoform X1 [Papaver somniferum]XP_026460242.1 ran-binding protein 1 homolog c-like isoform X1 [Papaver somniferum]
MITFKFPELNGEKDFLKGATPRKLYKYPTNTESAEVAPIITLEEEDVLFNLFDKDGKYWKERGNGFIKLLKHKETKKFCFVRRQSKTLKVIANHLVLATISIQKHIWSQKSWIWHASDFSDSELREEVFCARFVYIQDAKLFKEMVAEAAESQVQKSEEIKEGATSPAADLTEKSSISEKKDVPNIFRFLTDAESQVQNSEESKEGATSLAAIIEKMDVSNIFRFSMVAESQGQISEESKEVTSLAANLTENLSVGEKKDVSNVFQFSTAEKVKKDE